MPVATGASLLLHGLLAIAISTTFINSALAPQSIAVTVTLTQSNTAPTDSQHIASENQLARPGQLLESVQEQQASARLAIMQAEALESLDAADIAAEVERLQGELSQAQQDQVQNTRLGSVAARRALDADYLRKWVNRVQAVGNAALNSVGSARGDVSFGGCRSIRHTARCDSTGIIRVSPFGSRCDKDGPGCGALSSFPSRFERTSR
jgi:hypothetical protein